MLLPPMLLLPMLLPLLLLAPAAGALAAVVGYPLADRAADSVGVAMGCNGIFLRAARFHSGLSI